MAIDRRRFLSRAGVGLLAYRVGAAVALLSARDARAQDVPLQVLTRDEARLVDVLGDAFLPGAAEAGLTHYLDAQLAAPPTESLLMLRYLDWPSTYLSFYRSCLAAVDTAVRERYGKTYHELKPEARDEFVGVLQTSDPSGWSAPPAPLFYFVFRADAVDVVYGTREGFEKLGIPYMEHIMPPTNW